MQRNLAQILAQIHAEFGIYDSAMFSVPDSNDIVHRISSIPELAHLHQFYVDYRREYITELQNRPDQRSALRLTGIARSVDLPFIGDAVVETGQAKYLVIFEGSLSRSDHLSITVLSCLWLLDQHTISRDIFQSFWGGRRHAYDYIHKCLGMNAGIARHCYITDAVRIGKPNGKQDRLQNRQLLKREIELLSPELVVLVGKSAADTIGNEDQREHSSLYCRVPFPTKRRSRQDVEKANRQYDELRVRWSPNSFNPTHR